MKAPQFVMISIFLFTILTLFQSCAKDNDLFYDTVQEDVEKNIEESQEEDSVEEDTPAPEDINEEEDFEPTDPISADLKAFPSAVGFGKNATGGRGGRVIKVTNLNDSGEGSLRAAIQASGPRIVVFTVGGTIHLSSKLVIDNDDITIAGQSAPSNSGGITIAGSSLRINAGNVIMRYIRLRVGDNGYKNANGQVVGSGGDEDFDGLSLFGNKGGGTMIFDHCSFSWGIDENIGASGSSSRNLNNVTIQNCIIAEGLSSSHHTKGSHSKGALMYLFVQNMTFYKNYFAHNVERNVRSRENNSFEMINNVIYGFSYGTDVDEGNIFSVIGNHYRQSLDVPNTSNIMTFIPRSSATRATRAYIADNTMDVPSKSSLRLIDRDWDSYMESSPPLSSGIVPVSSMQAVDEVLSDSGVRYPHFDAADQRVINDYHSGSGSYIDTQEEVGGFPELATGTTPKDSDDDGVRLQTNVD